MEKITLLPGEVLVLRTCNPDMTSHNGFKWPEKGMVSAPDWNSSPECGGGLHGLLWGQGDSYLIYSQDDAKWLVCKVQEDQCVVFENMVKFPSAEVVFTGTRDMAVSLIQAYAPRGTAVHWANVAIEGEGNIVVGDRGRAEAGDNGHAEAGDYGQAIAGRHGYVAVGNYGYAEAGDYGQAKAGVEGKATVGDYGRAKAGNRGTAIAGDSGRATADINGKAIAGDYSQAEVGDGGKAVAGKYGHATAGNEGKAIAENYGRAAVGVNGYAEAGCKGEVKGGVGSVLRIAYLDTTTSAPRIASAIVSADGRVKPDIFYTLDGNNQFIRVKEQE